MGDEKSHHQWSEPDPDGVRECNHCHVHANDRRKLMPVTIQTGQGSETVNALHEEGGLAVTAALGFKRGVKRYCITHAQSGHVVGEEVLGTSRLARTFKSVAEARKGLKAILPLTDWTRPGNEVAEHALHATSVLADLLGDSHTLKALPRR